MSEQPKPAESEVLPPEYSMRGDNAYYLNYCDHGDCRPGYAICANKVFAFKRDGTLFSESCLKAMRQGTCQAVDAVKQEKDAGRALFYIKRGPMIEPVARPVVSAHKFEHKAIPINKGPYPGEELKPSKPAPAKPVVLATLNSAPNSYAQAINSALTDLETDNSGVCTPEGADIQAVFDAEPKLAVPVPVSKPKVDPTPVLPKAAGGMSLLEIARLRMQKKA